MPDPKDDIYEVMFVQLVMSLNEAAMMQMGKLVNPITNQAEANLTQAQGTIDLLRMLKEKTKNNLSPHEQRLIDQSLMNLQMNFVYEQEHSKQPPAEGSAPKAEEAAVPNPNPDPNPDKPGTHPEQNN